jgi:uncharacterized protein YybS (DUF2232 family)
MDNNMRTRSVAEAGLFSALVAVIILMNAYVPAFIMVGTFLIPVPITILYLRHGFKNAITAVVASVLLAAMLTDPVIAISSAMLSGTSGLTLGYCLKRKLSTGYTIALLTVASALVVTINLTILSYLLLGTGVTGTLNYFIELVQESAEMSAEMMTALGASASQIEQIHRMYEVFTLDFLKRALPGLIITSGLLSAYINYKVTEVILKRLKYEVKEMTPISKIYIDNRIVALTIVVLCIGIIFHYRNLGIGEYIYVSSTMVLTMLLNISGVAAVTYYLKNRTRLRNGFIAVIIIFIFFSGLNAVLMYIGIADIMFDFRKVDPNRIFRKRDENQSTDGND